MVAKQCKTREKIRLSSKKENENDNRDNMNPNPIINKYLL